MSRAQGGNFDSKQTQQLNFRLATTVGSQGAVASDATQGPEAPNDTLLTKLADAIDRGEKQIGIGTKFIAWLKSVFGGESYGTAIAKQAFSKIGNADTQCTLVALALQAVASPESSANTQDNVKILLKFCQAAGVEEDNIIGAINTIPDPADKAKVLEVLTLPGSDFQWDKLQGLDATVARKLVLDLANAGENGQTF